jgi:hypothetical protein
MRLGANRMLFLHATGGQYSAKFFESTLPEQLFEFTNKETI